jgi:hypothetical protein
MNPMVDKRLKSQEMKKKLGGTAWGGVAMGIRAKI